MKLAPATIHDWPAIEAVYREGIRTGHATFQREDEIPDGAAWFAGKRPGSVVKAVDAAGLMLGWAALSPVSTRAVYAGVAEVSIYVAAAARGRGVGRALMDHLVRASEADRVWTLQAGIFPENTTSIKLHQAFGFRVIGVREKLGQMDGVWRDVVFMERRSPVVW
jgi:L-amino acid N-acyltransferase YncA